MTDLKTVYVNGVSPADLLVAAGDGIHLISNTDVNNTIWLSRTNAAIANKPDDATDLGPQSFVVVNGEEDVYAITTGPTVAVRIIGGGVGYFQSGITGQGFFANADGAFFYNGTPGPGRLIESITGSLASGSDPFGNTYTPGGTDLFSGGEVLLYSTASPQLRKLVVALAGQGGTDVVNNGWAPGVTVYGVNGSPVGMTMPTNAPNESSAPFVAAGVINPAGAAQLFNQMYSGRMSGAPDYVTVVLFSSGFNGPTGSQGNLNYIDTAAGSHSEALWGQGGIFIPLCNGIKAVKPGTADTTLTPEVWNVLPLASGWSNIVGQTVVQYRMLADGAVEWAGGATHTAWTGSIQLGASAIPAAYRPTNQQWIPGTIAASDASLTVNPSTGIVSASTGGVSLTQCRITGRMPLGI